MPCKDLVRYVVGSGPAIVASTKSISIFPNSAQPELVEGHAPTLDAGDGLLRLPPALQ